MIEQITVRAANNDNRVAMFEIDPAHISPGNSRGEVFIVGDGRTHIVGKTEAVVMAIRNGVLVEVEVVK